MALGWGYSLPSVVRTEQRDGQNFDWYTAAGVCKGSLSTWSWLNINHRIIFSRLKNYSRWRKGMVLGTTWYVFTKLGHIKLDSIVSRHMCHFEYLCPGQVGWLRRKIQHLGAFCQHQALHNAILRRQEYHLCTVVTKPMQWIPLLGDLTRLGGPLPRPTIKHTKEAGPGNFYHFVQVINRFVQSVPRASSYICSVGWGWRRVVEWRYLHIGWSRDDPWVWLQHTEGMFDHCKAAIHRSKAYSNSW